MIINKTIMIINNNCKKKEKHNVNEKYKQRYYSQQL